jgi:hypothetical protein
VSSRRRGILISVLALVLVPLTLSAGLASAAVKHTGGRIYVYEVSPSLTSNVAKDVITGAITDFGTDHEGVAGHGTINRIILSKGSFEISIASLAKAPPPAVNPKTCAFECTISASIPIVKGSGKGAYAGITGTVKVTITEVGILRRLKSGKCNTSATPLAGFSWTKGSGTVSF